MAFSDEPQGGNPPSGEPTSTPLTPHYDETPPYSEEWSTPPPAAIPPVATTPDAPLAPAGGGKKPPKLRQPQDEPEDEEDEMARMSFLEHLEELRKRLLLAIGGIGVAFVFSLLFSDPLWSVVSKPAIVALKNLGVNPPVLHQLSPMDVFQIIWMKLPILSAVFLASPWILYQVWAFIAPGLYKKERRWAVPFVVSSAGLFIVGGLFAYFVAFRFGLEFLLGLGIPQGITPTISVTEYYDLFVDVMLAVGMIFEIPVLLFLLTLVHVVKPEFLVRHSRYAILAIVVLAAVITPTGDVFNLALFATPMIVLFYVGIFASYLLVLSREKRKFPWATFFKWFTIIVLAAALIAIVLLRHYGYHFVAGWPPIVR
jgi:sec-independent protein translocase protein TatC